MNPLPAELLETYQELVDPGASADEAQDAIQMLSAAGKPLRRGPWWAWSAPGLTWRSFGKLAVASDSAGAIVDVIVAPASASELVGGISSAYMGELRLSEDAIEDWRTLAGDAATPAVLRLVIAALGTHQPKADGLDGEDESASCIRLTRDLALTLRASGQGGALVATSISTAPTGKLVSLAGADLARAVELAEEAIGEWEALTSAPDARAAERNLLARICADGQAVGSRPTWVAPPTPNYLRACILLGEDICLCLKEGAPTVLPFARLRIGRVLELSSEPPDAPSREVVAWTSSARAVWDDLAQDPEVAASLARAAPSAEPPNWLAGSVPAWASCTIDVGTASLLVASASRIDERLEPGFTHGVAAIRLRLAQHGDEPESIKGPNLAASVKASKAALDKWQASRSIESPQDAAADFRALIRSEGTAHSEPPWWWTGDRNAPAWLNIADTWAAPLIETGQEATTLWLAPTVVRNPWTDSPVVELGVEEGEFSVRITDRARTVLDKLRNASPSGQTADLSEWLEVALGPDPSITAAPSWVRTTNNLAGALRLNHSGHLILLGGTARAGAFVAFLVLEDRHRGASGP